MTYPKDTEQSLPDGAEALEEVLIMISGHTPREIVRRLTASGIVAPTGEPLTVPGLRAVLAEPFRTGRLRYAGEASRRPRPRGTSEASVNARPHGAS